MQIEMRNEVFMARFLAFFTGLVLSVMITFNGLLSQSTNAYLSNVIYHGIGVIFFGIMLLFIKKQPIKHPFKWYYLIPGALGSLTIILNNLVVRELGVTLMIAFTLVGQVTTSLIIDEWGLLGKEMTKSTLKKWFGVGIMVVGLIIMVV